MTPDPLLVVTAGVVVLAYIVFAAILTRSLLTKKVAQPAKVIGSVAALVAGLPAILYAFAAVVG
ncbi:hypothetical protein [Amycolatopsis keratiniphila]|uniref:Uncharacterized protein n=1 Tax=Amycolatopsis keratiniphila subsp. keratiniphila TaxID=227715 RepID=A0A1W2LJ76_9PSEU|nr:hypothetical protein [Amycolatopsis keratiniphila]OLZ59795.1 hypothetical protein BS330_05375 [Amycolatopsis keratiniphila subsp. nogabecina]ONF62782.1 hypothetical protein AVR91_0235520 [Amycolatopsis keratiniphila subsp. keratiniphila]SDU55495.1 hypothetical protein SAMN04489733_5989 [Amycolatopsis keratiniphila]